jgi:hypothetical protein
MPKSKDESAFKQAFRRVSITELLISAKKHIATGENCLREAAEDIAAASEKGATQRVIAEKVGKSVGWVNGLLQWRQGGYQETPFGPSAKASRERAAVQSTEQSEPAEAPPEPVPEVAPAPEVEAPITEADLLAAAAAIAEATKKKAEARAREQARRREYIGRIFGQQHQKPEIHSSDRTLLIKALGMLGSDQPGERDNAALMAEKLRAKIGMSWEDLIVAASPGSVCSLHHGGSRDRRDLVN